MADRDPIPSDFIGKTIVEFDGSAINVWRFGFSDGTSLAIEVESFGPAGYGMVVCEECAENWCNARQPDEAA